ncbi:MAG: hypothetical protein ACRDSE_20555 [Pseudonocardiaceae bacterium]
MAGASTTFRDQGESQQPLGEPIGEQPEGDFEIGEGGSDGPQINTFTTTGDMASFDAEEFLSTDSSSVTLTAEATEVFE